MQYIKTKDNDVLIFTGGHHTSALVVAQAAKRQGWQIIWIGHQHASVTDEHLSVEYQEVTQSEIPFFNLRTGKIYGSGNLLSLRHVFTGLVAAFKLLKQIKVQHPQSKIGIVSFGGYLAVPVVIAGWLLQIPSLSHEQTLVGGGANRLLSFFVKKVALSWPAYQSGFSRNKTVLTGLPIRPEIITVHRNIIQTGLPKVLVLGGKQGSHTINEIIFNNLTGLLDKYQIIHQTGSNSLYNDLEKAQNYKNKLPTSLKNHYLVKDYFPVSEIASYYSSVCAVISRAGAHTVYELGLLGLPSVLIPIPWSSRREQQINAEYLAANNLAVTLFQDNISLPILIEALNTAINLKPTPLNLPTNGTENLLKLINSTFRNIQ